MQARMLLGRSCPVGWARWCWLTAGPFVSEMLQPTLTAQETVFSSRQRHLPSQQQQQQQRQQRPRLGMLSA